MTVGGSFICFLPLLVGGRLPPDSDSVSLALRYAPAALWLLCYLLSIRGYALSGNSLLIRRLIWSTRIPLDGLESIDLKTNPFCWAIRIFGNPGIFAVSGLFYHRTLGRFRAFVTDKRHACVLNFASGRIAVSPGDQRLFLKTLLQAVDDQA